MVWDQLTDHLEVLYAAAAALAIVLVLTPAVGSAARYLRLVDRRLEGERAVSKVPRLGGIALFFGVLVPSLAFLPLGSGMRGVLLGAAVATVVGAIDDFRRLVWWQKLGGQVLAAAIPTGFGVYVHSFTFPVVGIHQLTAWVGVPLTILGIVALMNMVNFLDGLDGLAAGVCAIAGATFCVIELSLGAPGVPAAILAAAVCGSCLGFLRHNFYPARIFMGDSGAMLLGFTLAALSVQGLLKTATLAVLVLPLLVLAVPVLDTSFVVAKRLRSGDPVQARRPASPPPLHAHRLLAAAGRSLPLGLVRDACLRGARDEVRAAASARPLEHGKRRHRRPRGRARTLVLPLRRVPARDREARSRPLAPPRSGARRRVSRAGTASPVPGTVTERAHVRRERRTRAGVAEGRHKHRE